MKRTTVLCMTGMAVAALLTGCAPSQPSAPSTLSPASGALWPAEVYPSTPGVVYEVPDPGYDGYDAHAIWSMCNTQVTEWYPQLYATRAFNYRAFFLGSVAMPGAAPIDITVRIPVGIRNESRVGTMVCYVGGGPSSPFIAAIAPYGFHTRHPSAPTH